MIRTGARVVRLDKLEKSHVVGGAWVERAERAETQHPQGATFPAHGAEKGGSSVLSLQYPPNPPRGADSEAFAGTGFPPNPPNPPRASIDHTSTMPLTAEYFRSIGVQLRPSDIAYLRWFLPGEVHERCVCVAQYVARWRQGMAGQRALHSHQAIGRFAANAWLQSTLGSRRATG